MQVHTATAASTDYRAWDDAEIARSEIEASNTSGQRLRMSGRKRQRYANPPADTPYPLEYAYHLLGDVKGRDVLDLGCGSGMNTTLLALRGARVHGLDISPALIQLAGQRLAANDITGGVRFLIGSAHAIDLPDDSIDVVFGIAILHHLDLDQTASEVFRVLRPGGRAIFQEPVRNSRIVGAIRRLIPYHAPDVSPYERPLTDGEVARFARRFASMRIRAFWLPHVSVVQVIPRLRGWVDAAHRLDRKLLETNILTKFAAVRVFELTKGM
jgi:SAM-dependent methyltransferase